MDQIWNSLSTKSQNNELNTRPSFHIKRSIQTQKDRHISHWTWPYLALLNSTDSTFCCFECGFWFHRYRTVKSALCHFRSEQFVVGYCPKTTWQLCVWSVLLPYYFCFSHVILSFGTDCCWSHTELCQTAVCCLLLFSFAICPAYHHHHRRPPGLFDWKSPYLASPLCVCVFWETYY